MDTDGNTPEFDIFGRIEKLETLQPTAEESRILAVEALSLAFVAFVGHNPKSARRTKDLYMEYLETKLSPELLKKLSHVFTDLCATFEQ